jgi:hypothetical protein
MTESATTSPLDEDVHCPLCDYNLRGLTEPRCPECGHRSTWEELRNEQRNHPYFFEQNRRLFVPLFKTWWHSLRPHKFWRDISPTIPIRRWRMSFFVIVMILAMILCTVGGMIGQGAVIVFQINRREAILRQEFVGMANQAPKNTPLGRFRLTPQQILQNYGSFQAFADQIYPNATLQRLVSSRLSFRLWPVGPMIIVVLWLPITFLTLLIFRASLRQARIRRGHVVRCLVYSMPVGVFLGVTLTLGMLLPSLQSPAYLMVYLTGINPDYVYGTAAMLALLGYRLAVAYREYLRFDRPYLTVLASQLIVWLTIWYLLLSAPRF